MERYLKKTFEIMNKNFTIFQVLNFCSVTIMILLMLFVTRAYQTPQMFYFGLLGICILSGAFATGWLNVTKYAVTNLPVTDQNDINYFEKISNYNKSAMKSFFPGVSEFILPFLAYSILLYAIITLVFFVTDKVGSHFYPNFFNAVSESITKIQTAKTVTEYNQIFMADTSLVKYCLIETAISAIFGFLTMYCLPIMYFRTKNPFKIILSSVVFVFKNFKKSIILYIINTVSLGFILMISPLFVSGFLFVIYILIFNVVLAYITTLVFVVYRQLSMQEIVEKMSEGDVFIKSSEIESADQNEEE